MKVRDRPSLVVRIIAPPIFLIGGVSAICWLIYRVHVLFSSLSSEIIVFDKGSYYMLGVGVGLLSLGFMAIQEAWIGKDLTERQASAFTKFAISSVVLLFLVPNISHFILGEYLEEGGYSVCDKSSRQWLHVRTIVYVKDTECRESLDK